MARKKASTARDIVEIIATFPWWVGVALAAVAYIGLHWVASWQIALPRSGQGMGGFAGAQLIHALATFGQYVLPGLFLVGSALSAAANWSRRSGEGQALPAGKPSRGVRETAGTSALPPAVRSQDLYELWKSNASTVPSRADQWSLELLRVIDPPSVRDLGVLFAALTTPVDELDRTGGLESLLREVTSLALLRLGPTGVPGGRGPVPVEGLDAAMGLPGSTSVTLASLTDGLSGSVASFVDSNIT